MALRRRANAVEGTAVRFAESFTRSQNTLMTKDAFMAIFDL